jgi:hypothetical protein
MNWLIKQLAKIRLLQGDFDYKLVRASMVIIFFFFGYQKWFDYEAKELVPFFTHGPLIFWMYAVFGIKGSTYFLGVSEWLFGALLLAGFWNKKLGTISRRVSGNGWERCIPDERCGATGCLGVPAQTGPHESHPGRRKCTRQNYTSIGPFCKRKLHTRRTSCKHFEMIISMPTGT